MADELRDHYGRPIVPGARVVFNWSGNPRFGTVEKIVPVKIPKPDKYGYVPYRALHIQVRRDGATGGPYDKELSRVTNTNNLVVLP